MIYGWHIPVIVKRHGVNRWFFSIVETVRAERPYRTCLCINVVKICIYWQWVIAKRHKGWIKSEPFERKMGSDLCHAELCLEDLVFLETHDL